LVYNKRENFPYTLNENWIKRRIDLTASSFVNLNLPPDTFISSNDSIASKSLSLSSKNDNKKNFIEPDLELVDELLANTHFIFNALLFLEVVQSNDQDFILLLNDLNNVRLALKKEVSGQELSDDDWEKLNSIIGGYYLDKTKKPTSSFLISNFENPETKKVYSIKQRLDDLKLLILLNKNSDDQNYLIVGPVFNYVEYL
jgi:hypothetical protein